MNSNFGTVTCRQFYKIDIRSTENLPDDCSPEQQPHASTLSMSQHCLLYRISVFFASVLLIFSHGNFDEFHEVSFVFLCTLHNVVFRYKIWDFEAFYTTRITFLSSSVTIPFSLSSLYRLSAGYLEIFLCI